MDFRTLFSQLHIPITGVTAETNNGAYGGELLETSRGKIRLRTGKVTPTKPGFFVTVWRRTDGGETEPFPSDDGADFLVITVRGERGSGMFIFPTAALAVRGVVSVRGKGGKRGFRLYPPWLQALNPTATRSQSWQSEFFVEETAGLKQFNHLLTRTHTQ